MQLQNEAMYVSFLPLEVPRLSKKKSYLQASSALAPKVRLFLASSLMKSITSARSYSEVPAGAWGFECEASVSGT